ncbi:hypothetical protein ACTPEM_26065, partial [Clostridioides difficile]
SHREGDIYTILANLDYIEKSEEEYILIAPSYMLCNLNYSQALAIGYLIYKKRSEREDMDYEDEDYISKSDSVDKKDNPLLGDDP